MLGKPLCKKCGHFRNNTCLLLNQTTKPEEFCQYYTESPFICEVCGNHITKDLVSYESGNLQPWHIICRNCLSKIESCSVCSNANKCSFYQDSSIKEQVYIQQTIRQSNTIMQTQVKNPKRIELTCKQCKCYKSGNCLKETEMTCDDFQNAIAGW